MNPTAPALRCASPPSWECLARRVGIDSRTPLLIALSGGADSVYLLRAAASARPRPELAAVYVDHGLRPAEIPAEREACARLAASLDVPFCVREVELGPGQGDLERRAREARYGALVEEALARGFEHIATGHHADDALETLILRWLRGTATAGLAGLRARSQRRAAGNGRVVHIVRPLIDLEAETLRAELRRAGVSWIEDSSNASARFARNRVRHQWLPWIESACGTDVRRDLRALHEAVREFEERLESLTPNLAWGSRDHGRGGLSTPRAPLAELPAPLRERALWRLLVEAMGHPPAGDQLARIGIELERGARTRHTLPGGWNLELAARELRLTPASVSLRSDEGEKTLSVPGCIDLAEGGRIEAEWIASSHGVPPRSGDVVELHGVEAPNSLTVRCARPGDRFHPLGAPGSRPLRRFLADAGIPREDRGQVPLVFWGEELVWVAGVRPSETRRVRGRGGSRLRLSYRPGGTPGDPQR